MTRLDMPQDLRLVLRWGIVPAVVALMPLVVAGCSPTVKVEAPDKPIEINLNIKIEQEVRVKVERDLEEIFEQDPGLFGLDGLPKKERKAP
ncbi:MAG TPA: YnbE family lipoprotein [Azospirillaceae bacterium]|nr:YnbE family lipoprotein [Azospirillaceae bacterium]